MPLRDATYLCPEFKQRSEFFNYICVTWGVTQHFWKGKKQVGPQEGGGCVPGLNSVSINSIQSYRNTAAIQSLCKGHMP